MTDEAVLAATAKAIGEHGLPRLTLALVAREAGLSPATLVQRFGSKRGLLLALARQAGPATRTPFDQARKAHDSPLAALHAALAGFVGSVSGRAELANHLTFLELDIADPEFRPYAEQHANVLREQVAALLTEARATGELTDIDVPALTQAVHVTFNGAQITWALIGSGSLTDALHRDLTRLLAPYREES